MKTNLFFISQYQKVSKIAFAFLTVSLLLTLSPNANVFGGISSETKGENTPKSSVSEQIRRYIQMENLEIANLKKGIVVISFSVNENNQISEVISHSQIPSLDRYLKSSLEGKIVQIGKGNLSGRSQQFVKIRFSID